MCVCVCVCGVCCASLHVEVHNEAKQMVTGDCMNMIYGAWGRE